MFNHQAHPDRPLGVSVGATYLAATRDGHAAVVRPSELTLQGQRLTGFVDRVGDPVPLVAPDGSAHRPERLLAEALRSLTQSAEDITVAVPGHWRPSIADSLRTALGNVPVVSDATAALAALNADPGLPSRGVVVLCDFGGSGTSITVVDASSGHAVIGETVRFADLSGDLVDQALLTHVMTSLPAGPDPTGTAVVNSLGRLRDECRAAKERLSAHTATAVAVDLPEHHADVRVTRAELELIIGRPVADFLAMVDETLERYGVQAAAVSAVATVGGGARIPLLTQKLSEHLRVPVVTTAQPQLAAAVGAALIGARRRVVEPATTLAPAAVEEVTARVDTPSSTFAALAWSEDDHEDAPLPLADSRPDLRFQHEQWQDEAAPRRSPLVLFSLAAAAAAITTALFGFMQLRGDTATPVEAATISTSDNAPPPAPAAPAPAPPAPQAPQLTTVVVQPAQRSSTPKQRTPRPAPAAPTAPAAPPWTPPPTTTAPPPAEPETPPAEPETPPAEPETPPAEPQNPPASDPPPIDPGPGNGTPSPEDGPVNPDSSSEQTGTDTVPDESSPTGGA
ncbi:hypothetical protein AU197_19705 [Mycobacterium sp. IS-1590]|uniref:Hsp70 family protein n=1 Tax=Mycobacterium sp. IS-1590 TaxID=1772286 RepID=UPI000749B55E|nr:Hsp70 family protein [Mycobacterium sp. IS-1590]KUI36041.1 hypothetical protein AU197_19705 [Mycobacterium sp. IS-1590]